MFLYISMSHGRWLQLQYGRRIKISKNINDMRHYDISSNEKVVVTKLRKTWMIEIS